jgi:hypothetical protein
MTSARIVGRLSLASGVEFRDTKHCAFAVVQQWPESLWCVELEVSTAISPEKNEGDGSSE